MALFAHIVLLALFSSSFAETDCVIEKPVEQHFEIKLFHHIHRCITYSPPIMNTTGSIRVDVSFRVKSFNFDDDEQTLNIFSLVVFEWTDRRLTWNPDDFGGIIKMPLTGVVLFWRPVMKSFNEKGLENYDMFLSPCVVKYDGSVECFPILSHAASCNSTLSNWPYDTKTCTVKFGQQPNPIIGKKSQVIYSFNKRKPVTAFGAEYGPEWTIVHLDHSEDPDSDEQLKLIFVLERETTALVAMIVIPFMVVSVLTMTCLFLDIKNEWRIPFACFSLGGHFVLLPEIGGLIPTHSADSPLVLYYLRGSLMITTCVILLSLFLKWLCVKVTPPPVWISEVNEFIFSGHGKILIRPRWGNDVDLGNSEDFKSGGKCVEQWNEFANFVNTLFILLLALVYLILYLVLMPQPRDYEDN